MTDPTLVNQGEAEILREALAIMTEHYVRLAGCGDCGHWNPEDETEVKAARALIAKPLTAQGGAG